MIPKLHKRKTKKEKQIPTKVEKEKKVTQMHFVTVSSHNKSMRYQRVVRHRKNCLKSQNVKGKRRILLLYEIPCYEKNVSINRNK